MAQAAVVPKRAAGKSGGASKLAMRIRFQMTYESDGWMMLLWQAGREQLGALARRALAHLP